MSELANKSASVFQRRRIIYQDIVINQDQDSATGQEQNPFVDKKGQDLESSGIIFETGSLIVQDSQMYEALTETTFKRFLFNKICDTDEAHN